MYVASLLLGAPPVGRLVCAAARSAMIDQTNALGVGLSVFVLLIGLFAFLLWEEASKTRNAQNAKRTDPVTGAERDYTV
eukprot:SAG31_NODE_7207_length_1755_cov_1.482488_3_plen_79_part_00